MEKIKWCLKTKNGLELIEPNINLMNAYLKKAEKALNAASVLKENKEWEVSSSYYSMYFSIYAILMKIGVKCEIHSCTLSFMKFFLSNHFTDEEIDLIEKSQKARINLQYYSDRDISEELYQMIKKEVPFFSTKCKEVLNNLTEKEIEDIRLKLTEKQDNKRN